MTLTYQNQMPIASEFLILLKKENFMENRKIPTFGIAVGINFDWFYFHFHLLIDKVKLKFIELE